MKDRVNSRLGTTACCCAFLAILVGSVCGCGHNRQLTVVVVTPTGDLEYWENFDHAVKATAAASNIHVELAAPQSESAYTEQAQMVEDAISRGVQGIIVSPAHQLVLASSLEQAEQAHIPVVVVGSPVVLSTQDFAAFVDRDEGRRADWRLE